MAKWGQISSNSTAASLLRNLSVMPRFCMLFAFLLDNWREFSVKAEPMLIDRMKEGYGVQILHP